jgi:hypothetical protein
METLHGREPGDPHPAGSAAAVLNSFFKKGMLTAHAERLIDLALRELELRASGDWTAERVKVGANLSSNVRSATTDSARIGSGKRRTG